LRSYATAPSALIAPLKIPHSWDVGEELFVFLKISWMLGLKKKKTSEHRRTDVRGEILRARDEKIRNGTTLPKENNLLRTDEKDSTRKERYQLMNLTQRTLYLRGPGSSVGIATELRSCVY
jgi:hypothetical protein